MTELPSDPNLPAPCAPCAPSATSVNSADLLAFLRSLNISTLNGPPTPPVFTRSQWTPTFSEREAELKALSVKWRRDPTLEHARRYIMALEALVAAALREETLSAAGVT